MSGANLQAPIASEEQLVSSANRLKITKNNQRIASDSNITDSFMRLAMPPPIPNKSFANPPTEKALIAFIKTLGYDEDPKHKMTVDSPLSKLIDKVEGELKFRMEIAKSMINDAIKESTEYNCYKIKKVQSEKLYAEEEPEEQNVSPV
uniref:Uncharacterized protein n=1 Tax=Tanacetum cinerariifolium TaxID=118510 RepID=A0A6L2MEY0_TANCI|nr:hypothetical protein [Tanacetum cinerariifolium]